jgi:hypothetical protein
MCEEANVVCFVEIVIYLKENSLFWLTVFVGFPSLHANVGIVGVP